MTGVNIVNVGYRSTNYWVVRSGGSCLLVDLGWPGMFRPFVTTMARKGVALEDIAYGFATHYHIDHAGCAEELKRSGMTLIVTPEQREAIRRMKSYTKPADGYVAIREDNNYELALSESRRFLKTLGFSGELVHTPGHSDDSVSLVLDEGIAFTGDLTHPSMASAEDAAVVAASWEKLRVLGVRSVYAGHGGIRGLP